MLPLRLFKTVYESGYTELSVVLLKMQGSFKRFKGIDVMVKRLENTANQYPKVSPKVVTGGEMC